MLKPLKSVGEGYAYIFNFSNCRQWRPVKVVFSFCGNFLPRDIPGLAFEYAEFNILRKVVYIDKEERRAQYGALWNTEQDL